MVPEPVTVTAVLPSNDPKLGKIDCTWDEELGCCASITGECRVRLHHTKMKDIKKRRNSFGIFEL
jgi:hypothetical protein